MNQRADFFTAATIYSFMEANLKFAYRTHRIDLAEHPNLLAEIGPISQEWTGIPGEIWWKAVGNVLYVRREV